MKAIVEFDGYFVTEIGEIWSNKSNQLMKLNIGQKGYAYVCLYHDSKANRKHVHRLVAEAFLPNTNNLPCVCHKNDIRDDNRVENLFWGTPKMNNADKVSKNRQARLKGVLHPGAKLDEEDILYIRNYPKYKGSQRALAFRFNVTESMISLIVNRKNWSHMK